MEGVTAHHYCGIDWAKDKHDVCVLDPAGRVRDRFTFAHTFEGLAEAIRRLDRLGCRAQLPIGIERPSGLLVDTLVAAGFPLVPIHPNALKATRPRYTASQAKADPSDAFIVGDVLRTDGHRFQVLRPPSEQTRALRAAVRVREDLVGMRVKLANQLRAHLEEFWPGAATLFADIDSAIALAFLDTFPTPQSAARLGETRLASFLKRHRYSGRRSAATLLGRLRGAPAGLASPREALVRGRLVQSQVAVLRSVVRQIKETEQEIEALLTEHPDAPLVQSFPRTGSINAAQIIAELGDDRLRFDSFEHLAAESGAVPVTIQSGKHRSVVFRFACNKRLRQALTTWADNSRHASAWAAAMYRDARTRGRDHPQAVRILTRAWIRVLWRCWQNRVPYDPTRHTRALPFLAPPPPSLAA